MVSKLILVDANDGASELHLYEELPIIVEKN